MSSPHLLIQFLQLPHIPPSHFHKVSLPQNCCHQHLQGQPVFHGADWLWATLILLTPFCFCLLIAMAFPFLFSPLYLLDSFFFVSPASPLSTHKLGRLGRSRYFLYLPITLSHDHLIRVHPREDTVRATQTILGRETTGSHKRGIQRMKLGSVQEGD